MQNQATGFLAHFNGVDQAWLRDNGASQQFLAAQTIGDPAQLPDQIYMVQEGLVAVYQSHANGHRSLLAQHGTGELLGEVAWLTGKPCTWQLVAEQPAVLLTWSRSVLEQRLHLQADFASTFYKAVAASCAHKSQGQQVSAGLLTINHLTGPQADAVPAELTHLNARVQAFKVLISQADKAALKNHGQVPIDLLNKAKGDFCDLVLLLNTVIGTDSALPTHVKERVGAELQKEFLPYLSLAETADRFYAKPRGYAGDFQTLARMYEDKPEGSGRVGSLMDACFLATPAAAAVRNRRHLVSSLIGEALARNGQAVTRITSLACGPAQELFDVYDSLDDPSCLRCSLIDVDLQALAFVMDKATRRKVNRYIEAFNQNLLYLASGRQKINLPQQDLMYSIGLIDYFADNFVVQLLNFIHDQLKPGGSVVLGNFHPGNPNKAMMDHVLEWKLIHRDEADMNRLFEQSKFQKAADVILFEEEGINLFAQCFKKDAGLV